MPNLNKLVNNQLFIPFAILILTPLFYYLYLFPVIEGDPTIYFSFAKNFFNKPFSFGSEYIVSFGATSPLYLTIFSAIYKFTGLENFIFFHKLSNLAFLYIGLYLNFLTIKTYQFNKNQIFKSLLIACFLLLFNFSIIDNSARHYESAFVFFYTSFITLLFFKNKYHSMILLGGLSYLVRPEILIFHFLLIFYIFIFNKNFKNKTILFILFSFLPIVIYHAYMFKFTGEILPSSILSRSLRTQDISIIYSWYLMIRNNPNVVFCFISYFFIIIYYLVNVKKIQFNFVSFLNELNDKSFYLMISMFMFGSFILFFSKTTSVRYLEFTLAPMIPFLNIFILNFSKIKLNKIIYSFLFIFLLIISFKIKFPEYRNDSFISNRLDKPFASKLNNIMNDGEKIALYEIELQYFLKNQVISLDSRVGSQLMPYFLGELDLFNALKLNKINYVGVDDLVSPKITMDPFYQFLEKNREELSIMKYKGAKISKILESDKNDNTWKMWKYIYKIEY